jgi:hypothetical protein
MATLELDWTAEEVEALRQELIPLRNSALNVQEFNARRAVLLSHGLIALAEFRTVLQMFEAAGDGAREMGAWKAHRVASSKLLSKLRGRFPCWHYTTGQCQVGRGSVICGDREICQAVLEFAKAIE